MKTNIPKRCLKCAFCNYLTTLGALCSATTNEEKWKPDCSKFVDKDEYATRNSGNAPRQVIWDRDYDYIGERLIYYPSCPACGEYGQTNENGQCVFCGQPLLFDDDPREENITVTLEKDGHLYELTEVGEYRHHWYSVDGNHVMHAQNTKRHTKEELAQILQEFADGRYELIQSIIKGDE